VCQRSRSGRFRPCCRGAFTREPATAMLPSRYATEAGATVSNVVSTPFPGGLPPDDWQRLQRQLEQFRRLANPITKSPVNTPISEAAQRAIEAMKPVTSVQAQISPLISVQQEALRKFQASIRPAPLPKSYTRNAMLMAEAVRRIRESMLVVVPPEQRDIIDDFDEAVEDAIEEADESEEVDSTADALRKLPRGKQLAVYFAITNAIFLVMVAQAATYGVRISPVVIANVEALIGLALALGAALEAEQDED
jgi:hypothetical protein